MHARSNPRFPYSQPVQNLRQLFSLFRKLRVDKSSASSYNAVKQNKPLEEREVESILAIAESRRRWECGIAGLSKWAFRGPRQRACALLDEDGTQTRYQAAPYDGTG